MRKEIAILIDLFLVIILVINFVPGMNDDYIKTSKLYISEIMASNSYTIEDEDGDYSDYIEIYNGYNYSINLNGYYLSDDELNVKKWKFSDITINPHQYLLIYASSKDREIHTNFKLNSDEESVVLTDSSGNVISKVSYKDMQSDISYGYVKGNYIYSEYPTPMKKNSTIKRSSKKEKYDIVINEYMTRNKNNHYSPDGYYYDWVELYNTSDKLIEAKNLYLTDDYKILNKYKLPNINIYENSYLVIYLSGEASVKYNGIYANFKLSLGEELILSDGKNVIDKVKIIELLDNISYGRYDDKWYYFISPTPGRLNDTKAFSTLGG